MKGTNRWMNKEKQKQQGEGTKTLIGQDRMENEMKKRTRQKNLRMKKYVRIKCRWVKNKKVENKKITREKINHKTKAKGRNSSLQKWNKTK